MTLNFQVSLRSNSNPVTTDVYRQPFGIRTVSKTNTQLLINGKPFYCHGVAKHEDSDVSYKMSHDSGTIQILLGRLQLFVVKIKNCRPYLSPDIIFVIKIQF